MQIKSSVKKIFKGSWFITLFATTVGVLLAFYLDDLSSRSKIESQRLASIRNIESELSHNIDELEDGNDNKQLTDFLEQIRRIDNSIPNELIMSQDQMKSLRTEHSGLMEVNDSVYVEDGQYMYDIGYSLELELENLQSIAWETLKLSEISNELDYDCLRILVEMYSLQEIYIGEQQRMMNHFIAAEHGKLLNSLKIVDQIESQLMGTVKEGQEEIKNCF